MELSGLAEEMSEVGGLLTRRERWRKGRRRKARRRKAKRRKKEEKYVFRFFFGQKCAFLSIIFGIFGTFC